MKKLYKLEKLEELKSKYSEEVLQSIEDVILTIIKNWMSLVEKKILDCINMLIWSKCNVINRK